MLCVQGGSRRWWRKPCQLLFLGCAIFFVSCDSKSNSSDTDLNISFFFPYSGGISSLLDGVDVAALFAVDEINKSGGIRGRNLHLTLRDTQANGPRTMAVAKEASVEDELAIAIGAARSDPSQALLDTYATQNGLVLNWLNPNPELASPDIEGRFLRTAPLSNSEVLFTVKYWRSLDYQKIVYVTQDAVGKGLVEIYKEAWETICTEATCEFIVVRTPPEKTGPLDVVQIMSEAHSHAPDALFIGAIAAEGIELLRASLNLGWGGRWYAGPGLAFTDLDGFVREGVSERVWAAVPFAGGAEYDDLNRYGANAVGERWRTSLQVLAGYDMLLVLGLALEIGDQSDMNDIALKMREIASPPGISFGPLDYLKAKELLLAGEEVDYQGASGPLDFQENGQIAGTKVQFYYWDDQAVPVVLSSAQRTSP